MTRKVILAGTMALITCVSVGIAEFVSRPSGPGLTKGNVGRIQVGMSGQECVDILGNDFDVSAWPTFEGSGSTFMNKDGSGALIEWDLDLKVREVEWQEPSEGIGDKFLRWLGWPWW